MLRVLVHRSLSALIVPMLFASIAAAQPLPPEPIRVVYHAPEGCPDAAWFEAQILARTQRVRLAAQEESGRSIDVEIEEGGHTLGRLSVRGLDGGVTRREVAGDDCNEVASALALVAALVLDPSAATTPVAMAPKPAGPTVGPRPAPAPPPKARPAAAPAPRSERPPPAPRLRFSVGDSVLLASGVSPGALAGGVVFAQIAREASSFSPALRVGLARALSGPIDTAAGAAHLDWTVGVLDLRPWSFALDRLVLAPTLEVEVGALHGSGWGVAVPQHPTRPWMSLGVGAGASFRFYGPLFLDLTATASVPFIRDNFYFDPDPSRTVSRAAVVGVRGALGLGVRFP